ncbi:hypothetical protein MRB53_030818 [Persea americana]|uniref:Uncharacterized protein n=1 Tax=Persea americana TaxID=3435 RepID=A0ACC2KMV8_PERAE|nr:hypothetical protein MRB53_030818 [Persea americana]
MPSFVSLLEEADRNLAAELHTTGTAAEPAHSWCCHRAGRAGTDAEPVDGRYCYRPCGSACRAGPVVALPRLMEEVDKNIGLVALLRSWFCCRAAELSQLVLSPKLAESWCNGNAPTLSTESEAYPDVACSDDEDLLDSEVGTETSSELVGASSGSISFF